MQRYERGDSSSYLGGTAGVGLPACSSALLKSDTGFYGFRIYGDPLRVRGTRPGPGGSSTHVVAPYNQNALILLLRRDLVRQDRVERRLAVRDLREVDDERLEPRLLRDERAQRRVDAPPLADGQLRVEQGVVAERVAEPRDGVRRRRRRGDGVEALAQRRPELRRRGPGEDPDRLAAGRGAVGPELMSLGVVLRRPLRERAEQVRRGAARGPAGVGGAQAPDAKRPERAAELRGR